jgi:hypothetical protein
MPWVRIEDDMPNHPKVAKLSDAGFRAYVTAICHAAHFLTDGIVAVESLNKVKPVAVKEVLAAGLFEETTAGIEVHDFLEFNPSREETLERRKVRAEMGSRGGRISAAKRKQELKPRLESQPSKHSSGHSSVDMERSSKQNPTTSRIHPLPSLDPNKEPISEGGGPRSRTPAFSGDSGEGNGRDPLGLSAPPEVQAAAAKRQAGDAWFESGGTSEKPPPWLTALSYGPESRNDERERLLLWEGGDDEAFTRHVADRAFEMGPTP